MKDADLDTAYTRLCHTMTALGEATAPLYLARFALLAMTQIADLATVERLIDAAAVDLSSGDQPGGR